MQIYRVVFIHEDNAFDLGLFASQATAKSVVENARTLLGFRDIPDNVYILPYQLIGDQIDPEAVYDTSVYCHDEHFDYEHCYYLGIFGSPQVAENVIATFRELNSWMDNADYETEVYNVKRKLGKIGWQEGFTTG